MIHTGLLAVILAEQMSRYCVDDVCLGQNVSIVRSQRGAPSESNGATFTWVDENADHLTVVTKGDGTIALIDLIANPGDDREIQLPGQPVELGKAGHVNYVPPAEARYGDLCGSGLLGKPCEAIRLDRDAELVMNFGMDNGTADWGLSEVILADRSLLIAAGRVIGQ